MMRNDAGEVKAFQGDVQKYYNRTAGAFSSLVYGPDCQDIKQVMTAFAVNVSRVQGRWLALEAV